MVAIDVAKQRRDRNGESAGQATVGNDRTGKGDITDFGKLENV
jgi:hypothetical protein